MRNKPQPFSVLAVLAAFLFSTFTIAVQGQTNDQMNNWSRVTAVASGAKLSVKLKTGKTLNGTVRSVSETGLSLTVKNSAVDIKREEVATIHEVVKKSSAKKSTLIGTAVGAGAGAAAGGIADASDDSGFEKIDHVATAALAIAGAGAGALVGYLVGRGGSKRVLLYEAK
jgi:small nuclear ribonucleoprotein (snRNP)-like protein